MPETDAGYVQRLNDALRTKDVGKLREFLKKSAETRDPDYAAEIDAISDEDLEKRMYKMILARPDLADMHADARSWLKEHDVVVGF